MLTTIIGASKLQGLLEGLVGLLLSVYCLYKYIDLARAKSEALDNIYSLFKQNIKSFNAKRRKEHRRTVKNNNRSN